MRKNFALLLLGLLLALTAVGAYYYSVARTFYDQNVTAFGKGLYSQDSVLGYRLLPDLRFLTSRPSRAWILTDDYGARIGEDTPLHRSRADVLVAGCSFTYGLWLNYEDTYPAKLAAAIPKAEVFNLGVNGFSTLTSKLHSDELLSLHPRVVVYGLIEEHFHRNLLPCTRFWITGNCKPTTFLKRELNGFSRVLPTTQEGFFLQEEFSSSHQFGVIDLFWAMRRDWRRATRTDEQGLNAKAANDLTDELKASAMKSLLREWVEEARANHFELVVIYIPNLGNLAPLPPARMEAIKPFLDQPHFHFIDTTKRLQEFRAANPLVPLCAKPDDCHPGAAAHTLIASELAPVVKKLLR